MMPENFSVAGRFEKKGEEPTEELPVPDVAEETSGGTMRAVATKAEKDMDVPVRFGKN